MSVCKKEVINREGLVGNLKREGTRKREGKVSGVRKSM